MSVSVLGARRYMCGRAVRLGFGRIGCLPLLQQINYVEVAHGDAERRLVYGFESHCLFRRRLVWYNVEFDSLPSTPNYCLTFNSVERILRIMSFRIYSAIKNLYCKKSKADPVELLGDRLTVGQRPLTPRI